MYNYYRSLQDTEADSSDWQVLVSPAVGVKGDRDPQAVDEGTRYNHNGYLKFTSKDIFRSYRFRGFCLCFQPLHYIYDFRKADKQPRWEETSGQCRSRTGKFRLRAQFDTRLVFSDNVLQASLAMIS